MLGHVRRRHAVAQLHLAPRAADLRALERGDQRPGLVAQAADLGAHRLEHLPHLPVRRPPVLLQPRDLVADALEVLRDRIQAPLDLLRALPELPAAVARSASRCAAASFSTCSETCRSASEEIAFICSANCSRLPDTSAIFSSVAARNSASCRSCAESRSSARRAACSASAGCLDARRILTSRATRAESIASRSRGTSSIANVDAPIRQSEAKNQNAHDRAPRGPRSSVSRVRHERVLGARRCGIWPSLLAVEP